jgi:hypothetical protein
MMQKSYLIITDGLQTSYVIVTIISWQQVAGKIKKAFEDPDELSG